MRRAPRVSASAAPPAEHGPPDAPSLFPKEFKLDLHKTKPFVTAAQIKDHLALLNAFADLKSKVETLLNRLGCPGEFILSSRRTQLLCSRTYIEDTYATYLPLSVHACAAAVISILTHSNFCIILILDGSADLAPRGSSQRP
jgi:hypothetical protein